MYSEFLRKIAIFENVSEEILTTLSAEITTFVLFKGDILFKEGDLSDALYIVTQGRLQATLWRENGEIILGEIGTNEVVGEMQVLVGGKRTACVSALEESKLMRLSKSAFEQLLDQSPEVLKKMTKVIIRRSRRNQLLTVLPSLFATDDETILQKIEAQAEWIALHSGDALFRQGEVGDSLYIVMSGRLKAVVETSEGNEQIIGEIARGESVGEMAVFAGESRSASVYALRDCELVKITKESIEYIIGQHPRVMLAITQVIIQRLRKSIQISSVLSTAVNIAIVPINSNIPLRDFCQRMASALMALDTTLHLNSAYVDEMMGGINIAQISKNDPQSIRLTALLDDQETHYHFILYETDLEASFWTEWCLRRADQIILIGDATASPALGQIEKTLLSDEHRVTTASQTLVLIHPNGQQFPIGTKHWLAVRPVKNHHHLRWDTETDFARLARFVSGRAVGLVLGGGGARGFAHFGVYLALKEAGVPVDMIGGTSVGAFLGAQCALGWDREMMLKINRQGLIESNPYKEYTLPFLALISSKKLKANLKTAFGNINIEDLWLNFFCISSNLSTHRMIIHREGRLEKAIRATSAIPGFIEPVVQDGDLLVDGAIVNNLPGDIMRQFCGTVIVVDVSGELSLTLDYEEIPSSWEILWSQLLPFKERIQVPSILEILLGATLLTSNEKAKIVKEEADFYLKPPVEKFKLLQFSAFEELVEVGYHYAKKEIETWVKEF